jgi:DNA-binding NtrC family response regulator
MPVVMMSGHATIDTAVEATRIGAFDFLEKPVALQKLLKTVGAAFKHGERLPRQGVSLISLGRSGPIVELRQRLEQAERLNVPLLLIGAHGSGMELCARSLHKPDTAWVATDHPEKLAQAPLELLEQARDGLLFVPEVADLDRTEQKGLLLLIQKAEKYDVRVVCATARNLQQLAATGQFDENLLAAISAVSVRVPALNDHREDIPELASTLAALYAESGNVLYREFDTAALNALRNANWHGNLTQLENVVRSLMLTSLDDVIGIRDVDRVMGGFDNLEPAVADVLPVSLDQPLRDARDEFERIYFEHHIAMTGGNMSRVAEAVGLERTHLYRKLKQLGINNKSG